VLVLNFKKIGNISVSDIVLGTELFGTALNKELSFSLIDRYISNGGNCIDTARLYGLGASEETIGEWLEKSGKREHVVISTKGGHPELKTMHVPRINAEDLKFDLEGSLKALKTDYIDIFWLHRDDIKKPVGEIMEILNGFINAGKVKEIGASNWSAKRVKEANEYAKAHGLKGFSAAQIMWSLAVENEGATDPTMVKMNVADFEIYKQMNMPVFGFASQGRGVFFIPPVQISCISAPGVVE
jgi:aryl-alcohol dehydrogenase-like predicted oxidoreductase